MNRLKSRSGGRAMLALVAATALVALAALPALAVEKEWICHAAGQAGEPKYVAIEPSGEAGSENSKGGHFNEDGSPKAGHEEDFLLTGDFEDKQDATDACNAVEPTPTPTPTGDVNEGTPTPTPTATPTPTEGGGQLGGTPTPTPAGTVPNTALTAATSSVSAMLMATLGLLSLGALAYLRTAGRRARR